jgi:histidinol-phosphatase (PHP family)
MVLSAIEKGFSAFGFSGHGFTAHDDTYCMSETEKYLAEIRALKEKYRDKIEIYAGVEEDITHLLNRTDYDYILGSSHYFLIGDKYYPIDSSYETLMECFNLFGGDTHKMAEQYYSAFCDYILTRKPDIVGHFDLLTKFDEKYTPMFLGDKKYEEIAEKYLLAALRGDCVFEVNTGAISRGYRTSPYPHEKLLHLMKKNDAKIIINSDTHASDTIDCYFDETRLLLKDIGFSSVYTIKNSKFVKVSL